MSSEPTDGGAPAGSVPLRQKSGIFTHFPGSVQQSPCYPTPSKALKVILDIRYQYAIVVSLGWHDYSCPAKHVSPSSDPSNSTKIFPSQSVTLSPTLRLRKSFNCNTYASPRKCCRQKTYGMAKSFSCNTYKKHGVPPSSQKLFSFFFPVLSSTPLGASEPLWLPLRLPSSVPSSKFRILQLLCLQLIQKHRGCGGILPISALIARSSSELFQQNTCGGGGTLIPYFITSSLPYLAASSSHQSRISSHHPLYHSTP
jgi:hypothetical protein